MMPVIAAAMTHVPDDPKRAAWARIITSRLRRDGIACDVVSDLHREGLWPTTRRAWSRTRFPGPTHAMALVDDMMPIHGFGDALRAAIAAKPDEAIGFFSMRKAITSEAIARESFWWRGRASAWGGTTVLPVAMLARFLDWSDRYVPEDYPHDDRRLCAFLLLAGRETWMTTGSLVQHVGAASSLVGNSNSRRVAAVLYSDLPRYPPEVTEWAPLDGSVGPWYREFLAMLPEEGRHVDL